MWTHKPYGQKLSSRFARRFAAFQMQGLNTSKSRSKVKGLIRGDRGALFYRFKRSQAYLPYERCLGFWRSVDYETKVNEPIKKSSIVLVHFSSKSIVLCIYFQQRNSFCCWIYRTSGWGNYIFYVALVTSTPAVYSFHSGAKPFLGWWVHVTRNQRLERWPPTKGSSWVTNWITWGLIICKTLGEKTRGKTKRWRWLRFFVDFLDLIQAIPAIWWGEMFNEEPRVNGTLFVCVC